jgi:hypothetical protein
MSLYEQSQQILQVAVSDFADEAAAGDFMKGIAESYAKDEIKKEALKDHRNALLTQIKGAGSKETKKKATTGSAASEGGTKRKADGASSTKDAVASAAKGTTAEPASGGTAKKTKKIKKAKAKKAAVAKEVKVDAKAGDAKQSKPVREDGKVSRNRKKHFGAMFELCLRPVNSQGYSPAPTQGPRLGVSV